MGVRAARRSSLCVAIKQEVAPEPLRPSVRKGPKDGGIQKRGVLFSPAVLVFQQYNTAICGLPIKKAHLAISNKQPKDTEEN